ncbi:arginine--tRNA ligase [Candidatus Pacearchaeota archaeon]|nr:arginine--tRNA ligase [Candidatus Pacearchaeota archaeon]|tara:strand:- start:5089 stop:6756 length:1668 start_codon:yes stop_codon:yes gene_type:complete
MKEVLAEMLENETGLKKEDLLRLIEIPPEMKLGDFAFPCFTLSKKFKKNPAEIAKDLAGAVEKNLPEEITEAKAEGPYLNFFVDRVGLAEKVLVDSLEDGWGENTNGKGKKVVIDLSHPNIAKPFGIGHLRSTIIGDSISRIANANGYGTVKINYLGDWGTQFGKIILAYKKWGKDSELKKDAIGHLQKLYVKINKTDEFDDDARLEFKKLEEGNKNNLAMWKEFKDFSLEKFYTIYKLLNVEFDEVSGESLYNNKMQEVIDLLKKKRLLKKSEGALVVDLKKAGGVVLIQKNDGTSLYATRDIAAAIDRYKKYKFDKLIYEVGSEQSLHFRQVFKVLEKLGFKWSTDCVHAAHGLYLDNDGKKFSTRKGKTVYLSDVLDETIEKSKKNLEERSEKISKKELEKRSRVIAVAAIKYGDLKSHRQNSIVFDIDRFLAFEGDTGPYLLYSYARAASILRKARSKAKLEVGKIDDCEFALIKKIESFPEIVKKSYSHFAPNLIANYAYELSQKFNEFYHDCPVMGSENERFRLEIVKSFRATLGKALGLLGIETLEKM